MAVQVGNSAADLSGKTIMVLDKNETVSGIKTFGKYIASTPASITGDDDINIGDAMICVYTSGGAPTGFTGGVNGRVLIFINATGGGLVLSYEDAASTAANRIAEAAGRTCLIPDTAGVMLVYLSSDSRWHVISPDMVSS